MKSKPLYADQSSSHYMLCCCGVLLLQRKRRSLKSCCSTANSFLFRCELVKIILTMTYAIRLGDRWLWQTGYTLALIMQGRTQRQGFWGTGARLTH